MGSRVFEDDIGLPVAWRLFGTGPAMVDAFARGELDVGYMGLPPALIGISKGVPICCVAGGHVEGTLIIAQNQYSSIEDLSDDINATMAQFSGKTVGVPSIGSIHDVILDDLLAKASLKEEVAVRNYSQAEYIAVDLMNGAIDAGVGTPALAAFSASLLDTRTIVPPDKLWPNNPSYGIFFRKEVLEENPSVVSTFLEHHKRATELIRLHPVEAAIQIAASFKIVDAQHVYSILRMSPKYCVALSREYIDATMAFSRTLSERGYIKRNLAVKDIFVTEFIDAIHPEPHHYKRPRIYDELPATLP
jgi:NitT/TauT family transport system substrate-binding protein